MSQSNKNLISYRLLTIADLADIVRLENAAWPSYLRATEAVVKQRIAWEHSMLGAFRGGHLIAMSANRYGYFDPDIADTMPKSFDSFANRPNQSPYNAAFIYNFALSPELRRTKLGPNLMAKGIDILVKRNCTYLVAPSRCPSYTGSDDPLAPCNPSAKMRIALDAYPDSKLPWQEDPVLSFYHRVLDCKFLSALPDFMPEDIASGGYAVGIYKKLVCKNSA